MFLCVSANPAIDKRMRMGSLTVGQVNRAQEVRGFPGGKAAHVAMVLRTLGESPAWIGPCGGGTGNELAGGLRALGILASPVATVRPTRVNLEIIEESGRVTEILEPGAQLSESELNEFVLACEAVFAEGGKGLSAIFSGSLAEGMPSDFYGALVGSARKQGCRTIVDAGGEALQSAIGAKPTFVKPNREEAQKMLGTPIGTIDEAATAVRKLIALGAESAALSLGAEGLLYCAGKEADVLFAPAVTLQPISTVGCGDSALAGFAEAFAKGMSSEDAVRLATACAAANCLADSPGMARRADIDGFMGRIEVRKLAERA